MARAPRTSQSRIATELGLSVASVSRALQGSHEISEATRRDVLCTAARLGYVHVKRHGFHSGEQRPIAVSAIVVADLAMWPSYSTWPSALRGVVEQAALRRIDLSIHYLSPDDPESLQRLSGAVSRDAAAILLHPPRPGVGECLAGILPLIGVVHLHHTLPHDVVDADQESATALATNHLVGLGHRRIGFVGAAVTADWCSRRLGGFCAAAAAAGIADPVVVADRDIDDAAHQRVTDAALAHQAVTGWICANDIVASWLGGALRKAGRSVPQQVSITGVDAWPTGSDPPLQTSVRIPFEAMGRLAVDAARWRAADPAALSRRHCLPVELILGASTGPPPS